MEGETPLFKGGGMMLKKILQLIFGKSKSQEMLEESIRRHQEDIDRCKKETEEFIRRIKETYDLD